MARRLHRSRRRGCLRHDAQLLRRCRNEARQCAPQAVAGLGPRRPRRGYKGMKPKSAGVALVLVLMAGLVPLAAQERRAAPAFDGAAALRHVERLVAIGPRVAGSPGGLKARQYIVDTLRAAGVTVRGGPFRPDPPPGRPPIANTLGALP